MIKPQSLPATPQIELWESLRSDFLAQEMAPTSDNPRGLTPSEAAPQAHARMRDAFTAMFPGRPLPFTPAAPAASQRAEPLPGGAGKTSDGRTWFPIARVEDDRSSFKPAERLTTAELSDMAAGYDPSSQHRAPVITPQGGPAHFTGEFASAKDGVAGHVDAVDFDGHMLWGLVSQVNGGVDKAVANGLETRSIGSWIKRKEAGGKPYLRHLALTAEPAGTHNLGDIRKYYPGTSATTRTTSDGEMRFRTLADLPELHQQRSRTMANENDAPEINYDEIATRVDALQVARAAKAAVKTDAPDFEGMISRAVGAITKPLTDKIATLESAVTASAEAAAKSAAEARLTRVRSTLDDAVRDGRVLPAEREGLEKLLVLPAVSEAQVEEQLVAISKRTAIPLARNRTMIHVDEQTVVEIPGEFAPLPGYNVDPDGVAAVLRARTVAAKETDPDKAYQIFRAELFRQAGEPLN